MTDALPPQPAPAPAADEGDDDPIYLTALEVECDEALAAEMSEWDVAAGDGLLPAD